MAAQQNQINLGNENCVPLQGMVSCLSFILFPGLFVFEIVAHSPDGTAKLFLEMNVDVVRK